MAEKFVFAPAVREAIAVKVTLAGVCNSGKTTAALRLAYGLCERWDRVFVADTENRRALYTVGQVYGDLTIGQFQHCPVAPPYSPQRLVELVRQAESSGACDVLIIDSLSKEWEGQGGTLEMVESAGSGANKFSAWKGPGEAHRKFIDAVQFSSMHVVCTLRSKMKYDLVEEVKPNGQVVSKPVKRGLEAVARGGTEYEFDVAWRLDESHLAWVDKDNPNLFGADPPDKLSEGHGRRIVEWLRGAASQIGSPDWVARRCQQLSEYGGSEDGLKTLWSQVSPHRGRLAPADYDRLLAAKDAGKARLAKNAS